MTPMKEDLADGFKKADVVIVAMGYETNTVIAIKTNSEGLGRISGERIWSEWKKILSGRFGDQVIFQLQITIKYIH